MRLTRRTSLQLSSAASSSTGLVRGHHRLTVHRRPYSSSLCRITVVAAAGRATDEDPDTDGSPEARPHRGWATAAEHVGVQAFLQDALSIDEAAALDVIRRGSFSPSSFLRLVECQAWAAYLTRLAGGNTATVTAILRRQPQMLAHSCDEQRLALLQNHLQQTLSIEPPQFLLMVMRRPNLLWATPDTVAAASHFLLAHSSGDAASVRDAVVGHPNLLGASTSRLRATLQWLTGTLGAPPAAALRMLPVLVGPSVDSTLEPGRQWFLREGLSQAQVLSLAQAAPASLYRDMEGQLAQLKLQYWRQQLGYSLSDLTLVPVFLTYSMARIASRHSALRHLRDATPSHTHFLNALIRGGGSAPTNVGPYLFAAYVKQHSNGSNSVQDLLLPLLASLGQPTLRAEWEAELMSHPRIAAAGASARQHAALYATLHTIQQRDWALSHAGIGWLADEAAAKAADLSCRAAKRAAARSAKQPQRAPRKSSGETPEEDAP